MVGTLRHYLLPAILPYYQAQVTNMFRRFTPPSL